MINQKKIHFIDYKDFNYEYGWALSKPIFNHEFQYIEDISMLKVDVIIKKHSC